MKIILATGGSGGHLFPALSVARELRGRGHQVVFLGSFGIGIQQIQQAGFAYRELKTRGIVSSSFSRLVWAVWFMFLAMIQAVRLLNQEKPEAVVGFGGHGAFPVILMAVLFRYPAMIHEQNVIPGKANSLLSGIVQKVAISFAKTRRYFNPRKTVLTGCPTHIDPHKFCDRADALKKLRLDENKTTILVFGGSQGSQRINEVFIEAVKLLTKPTDFQVIHISGKSDLARLESQYRQTKIPFALFEFLEDIHLAYCAADLVVCRAGAVTVTELAMFKKRAVFIPYPYAGAHQKENAMLLRELKMADIIDQEHLTPSRLKDAIEDHFSNRHFQDQPGDCFGEIFIPDSSKRLSDEVINLVAPA